MPPSSTPSTIDEPDELVAAEHVGAERKTAERRLERWTGQLERTALAQQVRAGDRNGDDGDQNAERDQRRAIARVALAEAEDVGLRHRSRMRGSSTE
jgi:hypothetical protein